MNKQQVYTTLLTEFPYFKKLDVKKRELLCARTLAFIELTKFIGKQDLVVTDKMKILIAACSQQLTLSFKKNHLYNHFEKILIYPERYYSPFSKTENMGEMNTAGLIIFSWEDFYKGIKLHDNRNVGLHEFAHALEFMDIAQKDLDERFSYALDKEFMVAHDYIAHRPEEKFFRSYAATNRAEFFAVATEYFFESPEEFSKAHPPIYALFCKIYGQDLRPTQVSFDPHPAAPLNDLGPSIYSPLFTVKLSNLSVAATFIVANMLFLFMTESGLSFLKIFFMTALLVASATISHAFTSFSLYENGIRIHRGVWYRALSFLYPYRFKNFSNTISFEDVFSGNVTGDLEYADTFVLWRERKENIPVLTFYYYEKGKIKSSTLSLASVPKVMDLLKRLYLEKKVCIRIDGQIKRFEL